MRRTSLIHSSLIFVLACTGLTAVSLAQTPASKLFEAQESGYTAQVMRGANGNCSLNLYGGPPELYTLSFIDNANGSKVAVIYMPADITLKQGIDSLMVTVENGADRRTGRLEIEVLAPAEDGTQLALFAIAEGRERILLEGDLTATTNGGETALVMKVPAALKARAIASFDSCTGGW